MCCTCIIFFSICTLTIKKRSRKTSQMFVKRMKSFFFCLKAQVQHSLPTLEWTRTPTYKSETWRPYLDDVIVCLCSEDKFFPGGIFFESMLKFKTIILTPPRVTRSLASCLICGVSRFLTSKKNFLVLKTFRILSLCPKIENKFFGINNLRWLISRNSWIKSTIRLFKSTSR